MKIRCPDCGNTMYYKMAIEEPNIEGFYCEKCPHIELDKDNTEEILDDQFRREVF